MSGPAKNPHTVSRIHCRQPISPQTHNIAGNHMGCSLEIHIVHVPRNDISLTSITIAISVGPHDPVRGGTGCLYATILPHICYTIGTHTNVVARHNHILTGPSAYDTPHAETGIARNDVSLQHITHTIPIGPHAITIAGDGYSAVVIFKTGVTASRDTNVIARHDIVVRGQGDAGAHVPGY